MAKEEKQLALIKVDQSEMALRIVEVMTGTERPDDGRDARELLGALGDDARDKVLDITQVVMQYFFECMQEGIPDCEMHKSSQFDN